jgi:hypothetical protein
MLACLSGTHRVHRAICSFAPEMRRLRNLGTPKLGGRPQGVHERAHGLRRARSQSRSSVLRCATCIVLTRYGLRKLHDCPVPRVLPDHLNVRGRHAAAWWRHRRGADTRCMHADPVALQRQLRLARLAAAGLAERPRRNMMGAGALARAGWCQTATSAKSATLFISSCNERCGPEVPVSRLEKPLLAALPALKAIVISISGMCDRAAGARTAVSGTEKTERPVVDSTSAGSSEPDAARLSSTSGPPNATSYTCFPSLDASSP